MENSNLVSLHQANNILKERVHVQNIGDFGANLPDHSLQKTLHALV
jgi:hypothetical protein